MKETKRNLVGNIGIEKHMGRIAHVWNFDNFVVDLKPKLKH